ncbi:MAG TPA: ABC transporter permease [Candidatus Limnocylindria bacterium]|nr:ABC transporter permease [Candidatus Limnocylindria bacterium]
MTTDTSAVPGRGRRLAAWLHARPRLQLVLLLALPLGFFFVVYIGSLFVLFLNAFWESDPFSGRVLPNFTLDSFVTLFTTEVYRTIAFRTIGMAILVTLTCIALGFPIAYYMARIASTTTRRLLVVAVLMPLWASYLVKIYTWRTILAGNGFADWLLAPLGVDGPGLDTLVSAWLVLTYLWLPYMILPIFAAIERIPSSLLEASSDLGGRSWPTFRRVILPLVLPGIAAGSIFTFSLTLGDYIVPDLVANTQFIGNVIYSNSSLGSLPLAAAYSLLPVAVIVAYLLVARRLGAFESL